MKFNNNITYFFLIWATSLFIIFSFGFYNYPHGVNAKVEPFKNLMNWDGGHFLGIAENGYVEKYQYAFFPLYPLVIRFLTEITHNYLVSAVLVSFISTFFATQLLYKLVSLDFSKKLAERVVICFLFFPTSFFLLVSYSESLFTVLVLASFYCFRKNKLFWSVIFAALASATRLAGIALVLALISYVQINGGINKKKWYVLLAPLGFLLYCWYLYIHTNDPFYFLEAERHWLRTLSLPGVGFWETIKSIARPGFIEKYFISVIDLLMSILGLGLVLRSFRFLPIIYSVYGLFSILIPLLTPSLSSMPRFLLPIFPMFILIAMWEDERLKFGYQLISIMLLGVFCVLFINGYWVS